MSMAMTILRVDRDNELEEEKSEFKTDFHSVSPTNQVHFFPAATADQISAPRCIYSLYSSSGSVLLFGVAFVGHPT